MYLKSDIQGLKVEFVIDQTDRREGKIVKDDLLGQHYWQRQGYCGLGFIACHAAMSLPSGGARSVSSNFYSLNLLIFELCNKITWHACSRQVLLKPDSSYSNGSYQYRGRNFARLIQSIV